MKFRSIFYAFALTFPASVLAQTATKPAVRAVYTYADVADLTLASELVIHAKVKSAKKLKKQFATGVAPGFQRHLVTSDVISLVRSKESIDPKITYIIDLPIDSRGKVEKLTKQEYILFALPGRAGPEYGGEVRLVSRDAQIPASPEAGSMVRRILSELLSPDAPPRVTGLDAAFYSEGNLADQGETQIFLAAEGNRPVSLSVIREPERPVQWRIAVGENVKEGVEPPRKNTFLWYRLACFLPQVPPESLFNELSEPAIKAIRRDYATVVDGLGQCNRARPAPAV
jgi:hypothetical protein